MTHPFQKVNFLSSRSLTRPSSFASWMLFPLLIEILTIGQFSSGEALQADPLFAKDSDLVMVLVNVNGGSMQGDAIVITELGGRTVLMDTGEQREAGEGLLPFLNDAGISKIDEVLITHPHFDHYGGLIPLLQQQSIYIGKIYLGPVSNEKCAYESWGCSLAAIATIRALAKTKGVSLVDYSNWQGFQFKNGAKLTKLFQFDEATTPLSQGTDINDLSLVSLLTHNGASVLLGGDLNRDLSEWAVKNMRTRLGADVLKVPHHGTESLATDRFLAAVRAKYFLVPAPKNLWCSERSRRVREIAKMLQVKVYVNGIHGHIFVNFSTAGIIVTPEKQLLGELCG